MQMTPQALVSILIGDQLTLLQNLIIAVNY